MENGQKYIQAKVGKTITDKTIRRTKSDLLKYGLWGVKPNLGEIEKELLVTFSKTGDKTDWPEIYRLFAKSFKCSEKNIAGIKSRMVKYGVMK